MCNVAVESQYFILNERFIASNVIRGNSEFFFFCVTSQVLHSEILFEQRRNTF